MSGFLITIFVILWVVSAINSVRKAMAKAQAASGGPDAISAAVAGAAAQSDSAARADAAQRAARVLRSRMQAAAAPRYVAPVQSKPAQVIPPADQAMSALTSMVAPSMPAFDVSGIDAGFSFAPASLPGGPSSAAGATLAAGRQFLLTEGGAVGAAAIIAAVIIGPPVGLRTGSQSACDW